MPTNESARIIAAVASGIGPSLYGTISEARIRTERRCSGLVADSLPLTTSVVLRAQVRTLFSEGHLPRGWILEGKPNWMLQTILRHRDTGVTLRLLKESGVTKNGVPHAGRNPARQQDWIRGFDSLEVNAPENVSRDALLLWKDTHDGISLRVVRTVEQGQYGGLVNCDLDVTLAAAPEDIITRYAFDTTDEDDFFAVIDDQDELSQDQ